VAEVEPVEEIAEVAAPSALDLPPAEVEGRVEEPSGVFPAAEPEPAPEPEPVELAPEPQPVAAAQDDVVEDAVPLISPPEENEEPAPPPPAAKKEEKKTQVRFSWKRK
jgi:hypothetical protein